MTELDQFDTDCDLASARATQSPVHRRDPRTDPMPGDVIRKWDQNFTVARAAMGWVQLNPHWAGGILRFQDWAKNAEVVSVDPALPPKGLEIPEGWCND